MSRHLTRDRLAVLAGFAVPLGLAAVLVPFRAGDVRSGPAAHSADTDRFLRGRSRDDRAVVPDGLDDPISLVQGSRFAPPQAHLGASVDRAGPGASRVPSSDRPAGGFNALRHLGTGDKDLLRRPLCNEKDPLTAGARVGLTDPDSPLAREIRKAIRNDGLAISRFVMIGAAEDAGRLRSEDGEPTLVEPPTRTSIRRRIRISVFLVRLPLIVSCCGP